MKNKSILYAYQNLKLSSSSFHVKGYYGLLFGIVSASLCLMWATKTLIPSTAAPALCWERSCAINTGNPGDSQELCYIQASFILLNRQTGFLFPNCMKCFQSAHPDEDPLEEITALILWWKKSTGRWTLLGPSICPCALKVLSHSLELFVFLV